MVDEHDIDRLQKEHERRADAAADPTDWSAGAYDDFLQLLSELFWLLGIALVVVVAIALAFALGDIGTTLP